MKALIDADIICYTVAFACADEDWEQVQHTVDAHINEIVHNSGADDFELFLTGSECWRRAKYPDYKGQRKQEKPEWHSHIKEYLINDYNAIVTDDGREADDIISEMCTAHYKDVLISSFEIPMPCSWEDNIKQDCNLVACSSDKDFNTFPGFHYNPKWKVKYWVSEEDAELWFQCQMIMGDTVDNIKGIPGLGKMAAYKILSEAEDPALAVIAQYKTKFEDDWEQEYNKNYELLRIG